ncbi:MAG: hypothetical protein FJ276_13795 [Planctomycetes bacterium]|nr:hypothetical protein [Planctomycetota bacterium]
MVDSHRGLLAGIGSLLAQADKLPITQQDPSTRAKAIGALILLAIGGVALVTFAWLALRVGRRQLRREDGLVGQRRGNASSDDWARKPLVPRPPADRRGDGTDQ